MKYVLILCALTWASVTYGQEEDMPLESPHQEVSTSNLLGRTLFLPGLSLVFPGTGQFIEGDVLHGTAYVGAWGLGLAYGSYNTEKVRDYRQTSAYAFSRKEERENRQTSGEYERKAQLGYQLSFAAGSFSAYETFRSRAAALKPDGAFTFLEHDESVGDILVAPLHFQYLQNANTWVPLGIITGIAIVSAVVPLGHDLVHDKLSGSDMLFASSFSFAAGTHEEALFRGWILPLSYQMTDSFFWSNALTTTLFAAAHLGTVDVPVAQLLLGWHLGQVTIDNRWRISEGVFIHTWWDVMAFISAYTIKKRVPDANITPVLWLPPLEFQF